MAKETDHLKIIHTLMPQSFVSYMMNIESGGTMALFTIQRAEMGDPEIYLFQPARQSPVNGIEIEIAIPPLPIVSADQRACDIREETPDQKQDDGSE